MDWNEVAETNRKGTPASAAMALAVMVLPVPGRPSNSSPRRGVPPIWSANRRWVWNRSIERWTSSLIGSMPMTSSSVTSICSGR